VLFQGDMIPGQKVAAVASAHTSPDFLASAAGSDSSITVMMPARVLSRRMARNIHRNKANI